MKILRIIAAPFLALSRAWRVLREWEGNMAYLHGAPPIMITTLRQARLPKATVATSGVALKTVGIGGTVRTLQSFTFAGSNYPVGTILSYPANLQSFTTKRSGLKPMIATEEFDHEVVFAPRTLRVETVGLKVLWSRNPVS